MVLKRRLPDVEATESRPPPDSWVDPRDTHGGRHERASERRRPAGSMVGGGVAVPGERRIGEVDGSFVPGWLGDEPGGRLVGLRGVVGFVRELVGLRGPVSLLRPGLPRRRLLLGAVPGLR